MRRGAPILLSVFLAVSCRPQGGNEQEITIAVASDVTGIFPNPPTDTESFTFDVNSNVFEGLVRFDRNLNPEPALAESWENPDERTWIFHLRRGLRFSDGEAVTAQDVAASLAAASKRRWPTAVFLSSIESVTPLDERRVEIRTKNPYPVLLSKLHYGFVLPARRLREKPVPAIGTGPYRVERWIPGRELVLSRNPFSRQPPSRFRRLTFQVVRDAAERLRLVREGRAQIADNVAALGLSAADSAGGFRVISAPGPRVLYLAFRLDRPPFSDRRVREAIDLALDRKELIRRVFGGNAVASIELVSPMVAGFNPSIPPRPPDPAAARRLLADAGYPRGFSIRLDGPNDRYVRDAEILREVSRQLAAVGVEVEVNALPKSRFFPLIDAGKSQFFLLGWACETRDAGDALDALMHTPGPGELGSNNYQGLSDPALDFLIDQANRSPRLSLRNESLSGALARVDELRAIIPLELQTEAVALASGLRWDPPLNFGLRLFDP